MKSSFSDSLKEQTLLNKRYFIKGFLGSGISSEVFKCLDNQTGLMKAAKIYFDNRRKEFKKETKMNKIISEINSPYLLRCYESGIGLLSKKGKNYEKKRYAISEDVCKYTFLKILNGVEDLHKNGICHRDIKSENIVLVGDNYEIKLCDFGYSTKFIKNNQKKKLKNTIGTPYYKAPEILENKEYDGDKIDIFSIGALLFVLMTKKFAFIEARPTGLYNLIKEKKYDDYWNQLQNFHNIVINSKKFKNLFLRMVAYIPEERPTIEQIKNDEWLQDIINSTPEQINHLKNKMISEINIF